MRWDLDYMAIGGGKMCNMTSALGDSDAVGIPHSLVGGTSKGLEGDIAAVSDHTVNRRSSGSQYVFFLADHIDDRISSTSARECAV